jgi:hypothetical protein
MDTVKFDREASTPLAAGERHTTTLLGSGSHAMVWSITALSALAGLLIAIVWSFELVDSVIGATIANTTLRAEAKDLPIHDGGPLLGMVFAFIAGLAATFTACNCVVFSCVAPLAAAKHGQQTSIWRILGWMALGVIVVTAVYGAAGAVFGRAIPALSDAKLTIGSRDGYPIRLAQSTVVFVVLGIVFLVWGLSTLGLVRNPLVGMAARYPCFKPLGLGLMVGFFTVGRPFPLFRRAFEYAAETGNPVFGAGAIALHGLGNMVIMTVVLLLLMYGTGGRFERWVRANPSRIVTLTAVSMIVGGAFFVTYWGLRVPSYFGIGWFPHMPYK